jgi:hypothetical protein
MFDFVVEGAIEYMNKVRGKCGENAREKKGDKYFFDFICIKIKKITETRYRKNRKMSDLKVYIFQTDNRGMSPDYPFEFIPLSIRGNQKVCEKMGWEYMFRTMKPEFYSENHPALGKIYMVNEWLQDILSTNCEEENKPIFMVFLDTDAWVQNTSRLNQLIKEMAESGKKGAFSRDPYVQKNTYINSGSFILKVDKFTLEMYRSLIDKVREEPSHLHEWPWDQHYVSQYVWENREQFLIFKPDTLNTGYGKILRHNWHKTSRKIRDDLYFLCCFPIILNEEAIGMMEDELDDKPFPNLEDVGYDYMDFD